MAIINIGASTAGSGQATAFTSGRHIVKSSNGTLILFALLSDSTLGYKISTDNGDTWDAAWTNVDTSLTIGGQIDAYIDGADNIYLTYSGYYGGANRIAFRKLAYNSGSWSIGGIVNVRTSSAGTRPSFTIRSNGDLWICFNDNGRIYGYYSTDDGVNWNVTYSDLGVLDPGYRMVGAYPYGTDIRVVAQGNSKLTIFEYTNAWDTGTDIVASGITDDDEGLGFLRISDSEIYVVARTSSGIKVFVWSGVSWDAGTLLSNHANDKHPHIINVNNKPVVIWKDYDGTYYNISYRYWNGSTWDTQVDITSDADLDSYPSGVTYDLENLYIAWTTGTSTPWTIYFDRVLLNNTKTKTILSNSKIKSTDNPQTITSDALITAVINKTILSDTKIKVIDIPETILSDATIVLAPPIQKTILSDAKACIGILYDVNNKVNFVSQILYNINNKFTSVIGVLSNINNFINTVIRVISDVNNDFRTKKLVLNNVNNDIRFLYSWQKAADNSLQSLGKTYITVSIGGVLQTDIDVDTINISKGLNASHTASFDLGRAYDSTKPAMEATVVIKYNNWTLYSGYITQIAPADGPEKIRINCQDEYWKQNKTNVYYQVGHKPTDDKDLYYNTFSEALTTQHGWTPGIGNFVPETLNNFAVGKSDAISNIIQECGIYGWFYDIDATKKLWVAGQGATINLQRQSLGTNINLYSVISHSFDESVEDIVNKFRVQMGEKIIGKFNSTGGSQTYTGYNYTSFGCMAVPSWNGAYELLAKNSGSGEGWNWHKPSNGTLYQDVFKKYSLPGLNPELSSWSDRYPPKIEVNSWSGMQLYVGDVKYSYGTLEAGFSIDYEKGILTMNEGFYLGATDANGELYSIRAPQIHLSLWKKNYYTYTLDSGDDPETDISNPQMFFTNKMGSYSDTIIKDLNLSSLSIQIGGQYGTEFIPSWDDTSFAHDVADWELSKQCDKKIKGNIEITLDALCFYGIDLTKRIYISGITDEIMNITDISYNMNNFTVRLTLENSRYFNRTVSLPSHGE